MNSQQHRNALLLPVLHINLSFKMTVLRILGTQTVPSPFFFFLNIVKNVPVVYISHIQEYLLHMDKLL